MESDLMKNEEMVTIELVPVDEYHQTQNPNSSKPFSCKYALGDTPLDWARLISDPTTDPFLLFY